MWIPESHEFPHLMSANSLENCFFPKQEDIKLSLDPCHHTVFFPSHATHPKQHSIMASATLAQLHLAQMMSGVTPVQFH